MPTDDAPFPPGFLWGCATSAHQVEGGCTGNDWWEWEERGRVAGGARTGRACDWWEGRAEEDLERAARAGQNAHRLSLEWSRLEPRPGVYDPAAFARYRRLLERVRELGMTPMVTLYHFTLPRWCSEGGGWENAETPGRLAALAAEAGRRLGDVAPLWVTLNEPFSLIYHGYLRGRWPPGARPLPAALRAAGHLFQAHALCARTLRAAAPGAAVGISHLVQRFLPARPGSALDRLAARLQEGASAEGWLLPLRTGRLLFPWALSGARVPGLAGSADFVGVNYYGTYQVRFDPRTVSLGRFVDCGNVRHGGQDWGEPDPAGLLDAIRRAAALRLPVYVTETGICDGEDGRRQEHLRRHLGAAREALREGHDLRGFFYWSLVDNFEWAEGWETPFGLIAVDPRTQERRERPSLALYARLVRGERETPRGSVAPADGLR